MDLQWKVNLQPHSIFDNATADIPAGAFDGIPAAKCKNSADPAETGSKNVIGRQMTTG